MGLRCLGQRETPVDEHLDLAARGLIKIFPPRFMAGDRDKPFRDYLLACA
jgi:hypothetical protein